jgi:periplasmic protein TonB
MTAVTAGPSGPDLFRMLPAGSNYFLRRNSETFLLSLLGQAAVLGLLIYFTSCIIKDPPTTIHGPISIDHLSVIFSGNGGGGGGGRDPLPASRGHLPKLSLADQLVPPTVMRPAQTPKLVVDESIVVAPEVNLPQGGQIGDPLSKFAARSDGPGGPGGIGSGCCDGIGPSKGPHYGVGPEGVYPAGKMGVTVPQAIYSPEPSFSDEARKFKTQGVVVLMLTVGKDGHTYDIRVRQSLGMGLDEKAIEAVNRWRFRPATLNGVVVATQIAVEVDFHLY